jgi:hypothetical protein
MYASLYVFRVKKIIFNACEKRVGTRSRDVHFASTHDFPLNAPKADILQRKTQLVVNFIQTAPCYVAYHFSKTLEPLGT